MRDIRFRAWHAGNKNEHGAFYRGHEPKMLYDGKPGDCLRWLAERQNITGIMQFTGLKDINGVEIYEGDVVKVERYDDCFGGPNYTTTSVVGAPQWPELLTDCRGGPDGNNGVVSIEVIGNIYQNPELTEPQ